MAQGENADNDEIVNKKAKKRLEKKKQKKERRKLALNNNQEKADNTVNEDENKDVEIEYVAECGVDQNDPSFEEWNRIFNFFNQERHPQEEEPDQNNEEKDEEKDDDDDDDDKKEETKLSKKKMKLLNRLSVAELKQLVKRPDVVEVWDVTSHDPKLLVHLKSYRNAVPVPRHWCYKRKYLQAKRGIEKQPFKLPAFIEDTGIARIRQAYVEKEQSKTLKQQQKDRMTAKTHRMDVDYQTLHDAFFKYQTKPKMTSHGDTYFEGKEFEVQLKEKRPGILSDTLKKALGMPDGGVPCAPPWLINMQRYGPPPSYPNLQIPGLNAPLPPGAQFGYHPGGWGKPPVDEFGRLLYGDVFGQPMQYEAEDESKNVERTLWGELEDMGEMEEEEEEEEDTHEKHRDDEGSVMEAAEIESGISSVTSGLETPGSIDPRKFGGIETPDSVVDVRKTKQLYQVLESEETSVGSNIMGSSYRYVIPADKEEKSIRKEKNYVDLMKGQKGPDVVVNIDPNALSDVNENMIKEMYNQKLQEAKPQHEDVSDVFDEESRKRGKKRSGATKDSSKKSKWF